MKQAVSFMEKIISLPSVSYNLERQDLQESLSNAPRFFSKEFHYS